MRISVKVLSARPVAGALAVLATIAVAGCSSGPTLKGPSWNLTGSRDAAAPAPVPATAPTAPQPVYRGGRDPVTGQAPVEGAPKAIAVAPPPASQTAALAPAPLPVAAAGQRPHVVEVKHGDSLARIAAEHKVSIASLMQANKLRDPYVSPGQWLVLPKR